MNEQQISDLLIRLGFDPIKRTKTLEHKYLVRDAYNRRVTMHFDPTRQGVFFTILNRQQKYFNNSLWLPARYAMSEKKRNDPNEKYTKITPAPGKEEEAFRALLLRQPTQENMPNNTEATYMPTKGDIESVLSELPRNKHHDVDMILNLLEKKLLSERKILCSGWRTLIEVRFTSWF